ncbi:hypothetical protein [Streptomyces hirsutus]|uniref:hypothetical protein n=1 Tax=Streptomyces hirsutus TaxID=35620 RepID=UPI00365BECDD
MISQKWVTWRFLWFVGHWSGNPDFVCAITFGEEEPVAFAYGAPTAPKREWWREHPKPTPEKHLTFFSSELPVRTTRRKTGTAELVTRTLLEDRHENLVVLLVDTEHPRVQAMHESWGFRRVGDRRPFPDSPLYAVILAELPLKSSPRHGPGGTLPVTGQFTGRASDVSNAVVLTVSKRYLASIACRLPTRRVDRGGHAPKNRTLWRRCRNGDRLPADPFDDWESRRS